jgi:hypothetical protein
MLAVDQSFPVQLHASVVRIPRIEFCAHADFIVAKIRISADDGNLQVKMIKGVDLGRWELHGDSFKTYGAIVTLVPELANEIEVALDYALAKVIPTGSCMHGDEFDGGWVICDQRRDDKVVASGPTENHARIAAICRFGDDGDFQGLVAREFIHQLSAPAQETVELH